VAPRASGTDEDGKLRRLPPGRHGLSREFVTRNQRERLVAGTIASIAEHGYRETSVTQIAAAAGVSRRTFYGYFQSKDECFAATYDLFEQHLFEAIDDSGRGARSWSAKVRARTRTLVDFLAANPDLVRFSLLAPPGAGGEVAARGRAFLAGLVERLAAGHPTSGTRPEQAAIELEASQGAIAAVLGTAVESAEAGALERSAPQLVELLLTPFVGRKRAAGEAQKA
jgi:AcrR family transcriptional regulator